MARIKLTKWGQGKTTKLKYGHEITFKHKDKNRYVTVQEYLSPITDKPRYQIIFNDEDRNITRLRQKTYPDKRTALHHARIMMRGTEE